MQVIPELAKEVAELTVYQRTPIWVMPKMDVAFPPVVQRLFARLPLTQRIVRWFTDISLEFMMVITMWNYRHFKLVNKAISAVSKMYRLLLVRDKELSRNLNPDFDFGCKRPTISNSYYRAFTKPHVHLETSGIERIEPDGIVACDGTKRFIDTLVLATGFDVWDANLPAIEVIGREGREPRKVVARNKIPSLRRHLGALLPELLDHGQPVRVGGAVVVQHGGIPDAPHGSAVRRTPAARCSHLRGHRTGQRPLPGSDDHAARRFGVSARQLRELAVVLVQEPHRQGGSTAFPADVGA